MLWIAISRLFLKQRNGQIDEVFKSKDHRFDFGRLTQSVVFVNVCLTVLTFTIIAILRKQLSPGDLSREWFWLATVLALSVLIPGAIAALLFSMATYWVRGEAQQKHVVPPSLSVPLGPIVLARLATSSVLRSYVIIRYGFVLSCLFELLIAAIFVSLHASEAHEGRIQTNISSGE
jgi:hypothetical protein